MATNPFEGLGLQFMGKERQHMGTGPLGEVAKMLPAGLLGYALYKSGAVENLNDMFNPKKTITDKIAGAVAPDQTTGIGVAPVPGGPQSVPSLTMINDAREALNAMPEQNVNNGIVPFQSQPSNDVDVDKHVDEVIPMKISGDPFKRDVAQDMAALQTTQAQAQPTSNVGQEQMGKVPKRDGGVNMASIVKLLMSFA
jgi:hypothetical protein